jgi:hypothetical protein
MGLVAFWAQLPMSASPVTTYESFSATFTMISLGASMHGATMTLAISLSGESSRALVAFERLFDLLLQESLNRRRRNFW